MVNNSGKNGHSNGSKPNDEDLKNALLEYSEETLTAKEMVARLDAQFGYSIKRSTLFTLLKKFDIPSARKNAKKLSDEAQTSLVLDKIDNDLYKRNGPNVILNMLARDHTPLPRHKVRAVMKEEHPEGALLRHPGNHNKIPRKKLEVIGPGQEIHADGHEKLSAQALDMGGVGIPIYGFRQKVGYLQKYNVVPNARSSAVVGHLYLDMIVEAGHCAPVQMTVDKGSETAELYTQHCVIRETCSDLDIEEYPAFWATKSVHNIPIESSWHWNRKYNGIGIREIIEQGKTNGIFQPMYQRDRDLFHWLFSKIVQGCLEDYMNYWNKHRTRPNSTSAIPSGVTPNQIMACPHDYNMMDCHFDVRPEIIDELRERLPPREEVFRWVSDEFELRAQAAYDEIGRPSLVDVSAITESWIIFRHMKEAIIAQE